MDLSENPSLGDVLIDAIRSELETRQRYLLIAEQATDDAVARKMRDLADREIVHRARLERRYKEIVGKVAPTVEIPDVQAPADAGNFDLARALRFALEHERESESDYRFLAERTPPSPLKNLYMELAEQEWKHKREIENEYNASVSPDQFFLDV